MGETGEIEKSYQMFIMVKSKKISKIFAFERNFSFILSLNTRAIGKCND